MRTLRIGRFLWLLFAVLIIVVALGVTAVRFLLPLADVYRGDIEAEAADILGQPVRIGDLDATWRGLHPRVILRRVQLLESEGGAVAADFDEVQVEVNLLASALTGRAELGRLTVVMPALSLLRDTDGHIGLAGVARDTESSVEERDALARWLFRQGRLGVQAREGLWVDRMPGGRTLRFHDVVLELRNADGRHQLSGSLGLPAALGQSVRIAADITGDPLVPATWSGRTYLEGQTMDLGYWLAARDFEGTVLERGKVTARLWAEWDGKGLGRIEGDTRFTDLRLAHRGDRPQVAAVDGLEGWLYWERTADGWRGGGDRLRLRRGGNAWPESRVALRYARDSVADARALDLRASFVRIEDVAALVLVAPGLALDPREILETTAPRGELRDLHLAVRQEADGRLSQAAFHGRFERLHSQPWRSVPGINNFAGRVAGTERGGRAELTTRGAQLQFPRLFRDPLVLANLRGAVDWRRLPGGWRLSAPAVDVASPDITARASAELLFPANGSSPFLDISASFHDGDGRQMSRYLPVGIMPPSVVEWLDRGIRGGHVTTGNLVVHGRANAFPYTRGDGRFDIAFHVDEGIIDPAPGWPSITGIAADVRFLGPSMEIRADAGEIFSSTITRAEVGIANMRAHPAVLMVAGTVTGPSADKLRYLQESPLKGKFEEYLRQLTLTGSSDLALDLALPLAHDPDARVSSRLTVAGNRLYLSGPELTIDRISGEVEFSDDGVSAQRLRGEFFGRPVTVNIRTAGGSANSNILIDAQGESDLAAVAERYRMPLLARLKGAAAWRLNLQIPRRSPEAGVSLRLESLLKGVAVELPAPIGKTAAGARRLVVQSNFDRSGDAAVIRVDYGDVLDAIVAWPLGKNATTAPRGELLFGGGNPSLPAEAGLQVAGALPRLSLSEWQEALATPDTAGGGQSQGGTASALSLKAVDLRVAEFEAYGQMVHDLALQARNTQGEWLATIGSQEIQGKVVAPADWHVEPVVGDFERLRLTGSPAGAEGEGTERPRAAKGRDPRAMPSLEIKSKSFAYGDLDLGRLELSGRHQADGFKLDRLTLAPHPSIKLQATGAWTGTEASQASHIEVQTESTNVGESFTALGYAGSIRDGKGSASADLRWSGGPTDFALKAANGVVALDIRDGHLLEVEPGAGRIFGLLSLQALPRRLSLDFSDLFEKGFAFDRIKGSFDFANGTATTQNLWMNSPSARIDVSGRIDLAKRTYDQRALVTPYLSENLPLLGALAASPQIGAVIFLAQRLFKKQLHKLTQFEYRITGPWEKPQVDLVKSSRVRRE